MMPSLYWQIQWRRNRRLTPLYGVVLLLLVVYGWLFPGLFSRAGLAHFTQSWFPLALVAMAQAILMLTGGISLAVGSLVSLGAVVAATTMGATGSLVSMLLVLAAGLATGAASGAIVALLRLPAIIVTLAGSFIIGGLALIILPRPGGMILPWLSAVLAGNNPTVLLGLLILLVLGWKFYLATPGGIALYAAGENPVAAYRSGIAVEATVIAAFAISGMLCTLAGLFVAAQTGSGDPVIGTTFTLNSIAAVVLGGVGFLGGEGTMRGALAGSLLLTVMINVMFFLGMPPVAQYIAQGIIIVVAVALPHLLGRRLAP
ncbi:ABC transporter permease [Acidisoma cellulosilytica]|uniref:ABC transporter permease n=1 Tax=Acidisoma cellulosilyticum TaxID=2802395 RepID=A0A963Z3D6_9PROT|nr:ABC transporter permease [Acidisoma cellulosilyticum]MCB8881165.1 ABC transporter permease [Acidisoma cellulosilyticum]